MSNRLVKLKTYKELRETGKYKLKISGAYLEITPANQESPTNYVPLEWLGGELLLTEHNAAHPNLLKMVPELESL
jgi:hypothetical protein